MVHTSRVPEGRLESEKLPFHHNESVQCLGAKFALKAEKRDAAICYSSKRGPDFLETCFGDNCNANTRLNKVTQCEGNSFEITTILKTVTLLRIHSKQSHSKSSEIGIIVFRIERHFSISAIALSL
jgi:hypothetical protein